MLTSQISLAYYFVCLPEQKNSKNSMIRSFVHDSVADELPMMVGRPTLYSQTPEVPKCVTCWMEYVLHGRSWMESWMVVRSVCLVAFNILAVAQKPSALRVRDNALFVFSAGHRRGAAGARHCSQWFGMTGWDIALAYCDSIPHPIPLLHKAIINYHA